MNHPDQPVQRPELPKFVRVGGAIWLVLIVAVLLGALLAPHVGRVIDFGLQQTSHRDWIHIRLQADEVIFNLSTPVHTVHSYYSALYRGDAARMEHLTAGAFRQQMRLRLARGEAIAGTATYHSYVHIEQLEDARAVVVEKFHLFWRQGLRFYVERAATDWRIVHLAVVR